MSRPVDWWVLDLEGDPTPGSPAAIRRMARSWSGLADDAEYAETRIRQLMGDEARAGQGSYRDSVMSLAGSRCCLTGLATPELLSVHHIKFWLSSTNEERLDPQNGLVLAPTYGVAFMSGLLSFDDDGRMLISELMEPADVARLGLRSAPGLVLRSDRQRAYLAWHRAQIWRP